MAGPGYAAAGGLTAQDKQLFVAGLDEGLSSFSHLYPLLYRESIFRKQMAVSNESAPSYTQAVQKGENRAVARLLMMGADANTSATTQLPSGELLQTSA
jgi:hypothetical protein